jgi:hypothetical protein
MADAGYAAVNRCASDECVVSKDASRMTAVWKFGCCIEQQILKAVWAWQSGWHESEKHGV